MKRSIIPVFVPHQGCPNDCVFCNQKTITGQNFLVNGSMVENKINEYLKTIPADNFKEVAYFGGSFTGIDAALQKELLNPAKAFKKNKLIQGIRLSTRPDYISQPILDLLADYLVDTIELGVQSLDDSVLSRSKRGHKVSDVVKAVDLIKQNSFQLGLQLMLGLPGEDAASFLASVERTIKLKPDFVRIYPTIILRGTELADMYLNNVYQPLSLAEAVDLALLAWKRFQAEGIPVIRLGLQATEDLNSQNILAGPYHPAFRELVENAFFREKISSYLADNPDIKNLLLEVNPVSVSKAVGQRKSNLIYWQKKYQVDKIKVAANKDIGIWNVKSTPF